MCRTALKTALVGLMVVLSACSGTSVIGRGDTAPGTGGSAGAATVGAGDGAATDVAAGTGGTPGSGEAPGAGGIFFAGGSGGSGATTDVALAIGGETNDEAGTAPASKCSTALVASDDRNYSLSGSYLSLATVHVKPSTALTIDWSRLKQGLTGPVDPQADVDDVDLTFISLAAAEVVQRLNDNTLYQQFWRWVLPLPTNAALTSASTLDFGTGKLTGDALLAQFDAQKYPPSENSYLVELRNGKSIGVGVEAAMLVTLDDTSSLTDVRLSDTSSTFEYTSALPSSAVRSVPTGTPNISLDFTGLTIDALGRPFDTNVLDVRVVMSSNELTSENERTLLDLPVTHLWHGTPSSFGNVDLSRLTDDEGSAFSGIDEKNTWFLELLSDSIVPAPAYLIALAPCVNPR